MNDIERDLHDLLEEKARTASAPPTIPSALLRRGRRRQLRTVIAATIVSVAVLAVSIAGFQAIVRQGPPKPAVRSVEPPRSNNEAVLPYASISSPTDWYLLDTSPIIAGIDQTAAGDPTSGPILQLSNFEPGLRGPIRCAQPEDVLPDFGVLLRVSLGTEAPWEKEFPPSSWPASLDRVSEGDGSACGGNAEHLFAKWAGSDGLVYTAHAYIGRSASTGDRAQVLDSFATLATSGGGRAVVTRAQSEDGQGGPRVVLDAAKVGDAPVALVAFVDGTGSGPEGGRVWLGVSSSDPSLSAQRDVSEPVPPGAGDDETTALGSSNGTVVFGRVPYGSAAAEVRSPSGQVWSAEIVAVPASLRMPNNVAWAVIDGGLNGQVRIVGVNATGEVIDPDGTPIVPLATLRGRIVGQGTAPIFGWWTITAGTTDDGGRCAGIAVATQQGGGSGPASCSPPQTLEADEVFREEGGMGSPPEQYFLFLWTSEAVDRIVWELGPGQVAEGVIMDLPAPWGSTRYALISFPTSWYREPARVVAYDASGVEIASSLPHGAVATQSYEKAGAWDSLIWAANMILRFDRPFRHDLSGYSLEDARSVDPWTIWNSDAVASAGEVSLRGSGDGTMVFATRTKSGLVYCLGMSTATAPHMTIVRGRTDAQSYAGCSGGWTGEGA